MKRFNFPSRYACACWQLSPNTPQLPLKTRGSVYVPRTFSWLGMAAKKKSNELDSSSNSFAKSLRGSFRTSNSTRRCRPRWWSSKTTALMDLSKPDQTVRIFPIRPGRQLHRANNRPSNEEPYSMIFHEYTHLLVNNTFSNAPVWFNEGLAEYYSTFKISDDQKIVLGSPIGNHVFLLRKNQMLPFRTLFEVDHKSPHYNETDKTSIFYAQSWALMHYLIIGKAGRVDQLGKFIEILNSRVPLERAFQDAFGTPFEVMEKDLRNYIRQDRYKVIGQLRTEDRARHYLRSNNINRSRKPGISGRFAAPQQSQRCLHLSSNRR